MLNICDVSAAAHYYMSQPIGDISAGANEAKFVLSCMSSAINVAGQEFSASQVGQADP